MIPVNPTGVKVSLDQADPFARLRATAAPDTTVLGAWTFDNGACTAEGWTTFDRTAQVDTFFHVDDFAGLYGGDFGRLVPLEGSQSMWCGVRSSGAEPQCGYATPPGYGNSWNQHFRTTDCLVVSGDVRVDFLASWYTEVGYDYVALQVSECDDGWMTVAGGLSAWEGEWSGFRSVVIHDSLFADTLRVRFRFWSDSAWSDEDGDFNSDGAVILDSLTVSDTTGVILATELFEAEAVGDHATVSGNWTAGLGEAFGDFAGLFEGTTVVDEDPCVSNLTLRVRRLPAPARGADSEFRWRPDSLHTERDLVAVDSDDRNRQHLRALFRRLPRPPCRCEHLLPVVRPVLQWRVRVALVRESVPVPGQ
jgi:hypothetical protein